jgi:hypothetical protein
LNSLGQQRLQNLFSRTKTLVRPRASVVTF